MPRKREHVAVATLAGIGTALLSGRNLTGEAFFANGIGCVLAAQFGGVLPDLLEPGVHSWHRKRFHSYTALGVTGAGSAWKPSAIQGFIDGLRAQADQHRLRRMALPQEHPDRSGLWLSEMFCHVLAGMIYGLPVGYASHLILDARTPRCLPII